MHEAAIAERILEISFRISAEYGNPPIRRIHVQIGELQSVVPEALENAFDAGKRGTPAHGAQLQWETVPARVRCGECGREYSPDTVFWVCPVCDGLGGEALSGNELTVMEIELEEDEEQEEETI